MAKKRALGSGLGSLIPPAEPERGVDVLVPPRNGKSSAVVDTKVHNLLNPDTMQRRKNEKTTTSETELLPVPGAAFQEINIESIEANEAQPRSVFDEDALTELAQSIKTVGVLQPVIVRPLEKPKGKIKYELVMGERRLRASKLAGKNTIPAIIRHTKDEELLRDALLENLHRVDLNPLEEAAAYQQMIDDFGITQEILSKRIARSRPQISNTLRLLKLPPTVQMKVAAGVITAGHARALLSLENTEQMEQLTERIISEGLSVRNVEEIIAIGDNQTTPNPRKQRKTPTLNPDLQQIRDLWEETFQTRVNLKIGKTKGQVTIEFADEDDLERITKLLPTQN